MRIIYPFPMRLSNGYTYMLSIVKYLNTLARVVDVDLLCLDDDASLGEYINSTLGTEKSEQFNVISISNKFRGVKSNRFFFSKNVMKYLKGLPEDLEKVIYTRDLKQMNNLLESREQLKCKFIFEAHQISSFNLWREGKPNEALKMRKLESRVFERVDLLLTITSTLKNEIRRSFSVSDKAVVLPVGMDASIFECSPRVDKDIDILYFGSFVSWKGVDDLLYALVNLRRRYVERLNVTLVGVRSHELNRYSMLLDQLELSDVVTLVGYVPHKEVCHYLSRSKIGVLTNNYEGDSLLFTSPLKLYEYLGAGLKVVVSAIPPVQSVIDPKSVYFFIPENIPSLVNVLYNALNDESFDPEFGQELAKKFTWECRAERFVSLLKH